MPAGRVQVSPYFDMIEGTRALEIGNKSLDTGLIDLKPSDVYFDCAESRSLPEVAAVMDALLRSFMAWLDGLSLLVTVLSCRYVYEILQNYKRTGCLADTNFYDSRVRGMGEFSGGLPGGSSAESEGHTSAQSVDSSGATGGVEGSLELHRNNAYVNTVLCAYVIGLLKLVSVFINVAMEVLYEEEDIITSSMDLNFFTETPLEQVHERLEKAIAYLQSTLGASIELAAPAELAALLHLQLIRQLLQLPTTLNERIELFEGKRTVDLACLDETTAILHKLRSQTYVSVPELLFSRFVQVDCNNRHTPSPNTMVSTETALDNLTAVIQSIKTMIGDVSALRNDRQLLLYLQHNMGDEITASASAIVRGIFQVFFIRDDRSIAGLQESVSSLGLRRMESLCVVESSVMDASSWPLESTSEAEQLKNHCLAKISQLLGDFDAAFYQYLSGYCHNRCRQRQLLTRNLLLWESLQYTAESVEIELFAHGIGDTLGSGSYAGHPALPLSSYIYYEKLCMMVSVALMGFEQDVYSDFDAPIMYWYAGTIYAHIHQHLTGRMMEINASKLAWILALPQTIGHAKGTKKTALRAAHLRLVAEVVPKLVTNIAVIEEHLAPMTAANCTFCRGVSKVVLLFRALLQRDTSSTLLASEEQAFRLRMKPWSLIGTPEVPTYSQYTSQDRVTAAVTRFDGKKKSIIVQRIAQDTARELESAKKECEKTVANFNENEGLRPLHYCAGTYMDSWQRGVVETCDAYIEQLTKIGECPEMKVRMRRRSETSPYHPIYYLEAV